MTVCERCGRGEAEWRCQVCGKVVCENCARPTPQGVFCADHVPMDKKTGEVKAKKAPSEGSKMFKSLFFLMLTLTIGLGVIVAIGDFFIGMVGIPSADGFGGNIIDTIVRLKGSGTLILTGMAVLTALIGFAYFAARRAS